MAVLLLLLVPDIFMLGYVINRKTGSYVQYWTHVYHTYNYRYYIYTLMKGYYYRFL